MAVPSTLSEGISGLRLTSDRERDDVPVLKQKLTRTSAPSKSNSKTKCPVSLVSLAVRDGTHIVSRPTQELLASIGGRDRLVALTLRFYPKMFRDKHLAKFVADEDDPHAERLADWIAEKMSGKAYWSSKLSDRPAGQPYDRSSAHFKAWHSPKRESEKYGSHFKLDDTVIWMRLMFWSCREEGLDTEPFFSWFVSFIGHFSRVYERSAPSYAQEAARWSANPVAIAKYEEDGWLMKDALALRNKASFFGF